MVSMGDEGRGKTAISLGELPSKPSRGFPNGVTYLGKTQVPPAEHIGWWSKPGEAKHPSTLRKREDSLSSGERKGKSLDVIGLVAARPMPIASSKADQVQLVMDQGVIN